jgi:predicted transcriptional regulator
MEVHFTPEQEARLSQLATHAGTDPEQLVRDATLRLMDEDAEFRAGVRRGIAQADRGELIAHEDVKARVEQLLKSR